MTFRWCNFFPYATALQVALLQVLPRAVFADPYQLEGLQWTGVSGTWQRPLRLPGAHFLPVCVAAAHPCAPIL